MTEVQFLLDLLLNEPMTKELHDKLLKRIGSLEMAKSGTPKFEPFSPTIFPNLLQPQFNPIIYGGCVHDFPSPWLGTVPPTCRKCGYSEPPYTVTCEVKP